MQQRPAQPPAESRPPRTPRRRKRRAPRILLLILVLLLAWPIGLLVWANSKIQHTDALSGAADTPGTSYLLVGSDSRADGEIPDGTEGERADSILLITRASNGVTSMISLPRDTYSEIPGHGANKLNAAFALGGPPLLVSTVEGLTGITVDHYVEVGMGGVVNLVDAVGGVELCHDEDVSDSRSEMEWEAGCHTVGGRDALAFSRMRYSDARGDFGRQDRQRQVIGAVMREAASAGNLVNPLQHVALMNAGIGSLVTDTDTGIIDLGRLALAFRAATGDDGITGAPPIANPDYRPGGVGSTVLLDPELAPAFFQKVVDGTVTEGDLQQFE